MAIQLQQGKQYRTMAGDIVTVLEVRNGYWFYPVAVLHPKYNDVIWYRLNGETDITGQITTWDIIAEEVTNDL